MPRPAKASVDGSGTAALATNWPEAAPLMNDPPPMEIEIGTKTGTLICRFVGLVKLYDPKRRRSITKRARPAQ